MRVFREIEIMESYKKFARLANQKGTAVQKEIDQILEKYDSFGNAEEEEGGENS
jgi:hypothetical protein